MAEAILLEKPKAAPLPAKALETLGLSKRVYNCLIEAGVTDPKQLLEKLNQGDEEILALPGIGPKSLAEVKEKLQAAGLALAQAEEEEKPEPVEEVSLPVEAELAEQILVEEAIVVEMEEAEPAPVLAEEVTEEETEVEVIEPEAVAEEVVSAPAEELPETIEAEVLTYVDDEEVVEFVEGEEEEEEEFTDKAKKKKKDRRKRALIYDEEIGEVVARLRRKPSRRVEDWDTDYEEY
ncbi:MAG: hypothetical protein OEW09_18080 [Anaerolineae bacterium]|nr:hypothetical protein [Anaerolineae bacterium]